MTQDRSFTEKAEKLASRLRMLPGQLLKLEIAAALREARNQGIEEAATSLHKHPVWFVHDYAIEEVAKSIRALKELKKTDIDLAAIREGKEP